MPDPVTPPPWYSRIDWQGLARVAITLLGLYGIHVTFTTPTQPVVVEKSAPVVQPPVLTDDKMDAALDAALARWMNRQKQKQ